MCGYLSYSQEVMHTQSVVKQEYLNPAYNSFKDYISVGVLTRTQWVDVNYHPSVYGLNAYLPIRLSQLGVGLTVMSEEIGLRNIRSVNFNLTHNVELTRNSFLSFGYGLGFESVSYDKGRIITQNDDYLKDIDWNSTHPAFKLGIFYTNPHFFAGLSSNSVLGSNGNNRYLPGFDFVAGVMYKLSPSVFFRPDIIVKYYRSEQIEVTETGSSESYIPPVFDFSVNFLFFDRFWLGTSHRFNRVQTFSTDIRITPNFQLGYSFEKGIGNGVNRFNAHCFVLSFKFDPKHSFGGLQKATRHNKASYLDYLYR